MIAMFLFIVACGLSIIVFRKTRSLKKQGRDKEVRYHFLKSSLEFLIPFAIAMCCYAVLCILVLVGWEYVSLDSLIWLDERLTAIGAYTKLRPGNVTVFCVFLGVYALGLLRVVVLEKRKKLYAGVEALNKWAKRLYVVFVLLCSFTLLGTQTGEPSNELRLRIKLTRDGYADAYKQMQETVSEEMAFQLYSKVHDSFSPEYRAAIELPAKIGSEANSLRAYYTEVQNEYGIRSTEMESALDSVDTQRKTVANLRTDIQITTDGSYKSNVITKSDARQITYQSIKRSKTALENYRQKTRTRFISFLTTEDGKRLTIQGARAATDILKSKLLSPLVNAYPITEPMIDVLAQTLNEIGKTKIEAAADGAMHAIIQNPDNTEMAVKGEASKATERTEIRISSSATEKAAKSRQQLEQRLASIETARGNIDKRIEQIEDSRSGELIAQLHSSDAEVRMAAAQSLSKKGAKISQTKVNELINIMRHGDERWETSRSRNEGRHCTDYEYTSIKHYAATALTDMNSRHVSPDVVREARQTKSEGVTKERVTDPGWV